MTLTRLNGRSMQRVLVTGGCGFIGSNIAAELASRGRQVIAMDNFSRSGSVQNAEWLRQRHGNSISIEKADTRDISAVQRLISDVDAVLHLAAQVAVTTSIEDPLDDFEINARGTLNVLEAVRRYNPRAAVIFASTNKVYGKLLDDGGVRRQNGRYVPASEALAHGVSESTPLDLHSPYGCSKGAADQYVRDYARVFDLRTVVMRMSCIYGPRQFGNEDQGWIAHFLLQAIRDEPITIYGDGHQVRDALFISDAVRAWVGVLDNIDAVRGRVFNLGGGPHNTVSLHELLAFIAELRGKPPRVIFSTWRPGDQPWYVSDVRGICDLLGWIPRTALADGLRKLESWLEQLTASSATRAPLMETHA